LFWVTFLLSPLVLLPQVQALGPAKFGSNLAQMVAYTLAAISLWDATRAFERDDRARKGWHLLALSMATNAIAFGIYGVLELRGADNPFPSVADLFWLISYPLALWGILSLGRLYRDSGLPMASSRWAWVAGSATALLVGMFVFIPLMQDHEQALLDRVIVGLYPLGDAVLIGVAFYMADLMRSFGRGALAWPWIAIVAGALVLGYTDAVYGVLDIHELYHTGSVIDLGWIWSGLLFGLGGLLQRGIMTGDLGPGRNEP
jgi:hypothetical protein